MEILFIDDSATMRAVISEQISELGYHAFPVGGGYEALESLKTRLPDLILLDVNMPEIDGYTTAVKIRDYLKDDWIPIIFLSGNIKDEDIAEGIKHGGDDYLTKPVSLTVLDAKLTAMNRIANMRKSLLDMTKKVESANGKLLRMAMLDELTGVANRRCFNETLEQLWKNSKNNNTPTSLLMVDVDHFKTYNDSNGHQQGDDCLKRIGRIIEDSLIHKTDLACRYGGEEFSVILPDTDVQGCTMVAEKIRENIFAEDMSYNNPTIQHAVSASVGCASLVFNDSINPHMLIKCADEALYQAKSQGRNQVVTYEKKHANAA